MFIRPRGIKPITKTFLDEKTAKIWAKKAEGDYEIIGVLPDMESYRRTLKELINGVEPDARVLEQDCLSDRFRVAITNSPLTGSDDAHPT